MAAKIIQKSDFENILSLSFEYQNQLKLKGFLQNSANDLKQLKLNANIEYQIWLKLKGFLQNSANHLKQLKLNANIEYQSWLKLLQNSANI